MPPRKFEELIAAMLHNHGCHVTLSPETRDGGFDIMAVRHDRILGDTVSLVECKRYAQNRRIDVDIPRRLLGVVNSMDAHRGLVVTTSSLTAPANSFVSQNSAILGAKDFLDLTQWIGSI